MNRLHKEYHTAALLYNPSKRENITRKHKEQEYLHISRIQCTFHLRLNVLTDNCFQSKKYVNLYATSFTTTHSDQSLIKSSIFNTNPTHSSARKQKGKMIKREKSLLIKRLMEMEARSCYGNMSVVDIFKATPRKICNSTIHLLTFE